MTSIEKAGRKLEALARREFREELGDLTDSEVHLVRSAASPDSAICGITTADGQFDYEHPANLPEFCETGDAMEGTQPWAANRTIRAEIIRWLCVNRNATELVDPTGIEVLGARIVDKLDIQFVSIRFPLSFGRCRFLDEIVMKGTQLSELELRGTWADRGLNATFAHVAGPVFLSYGFRANGIVNLDGITIDGHLNCRGGVFHSPGPFALSLQHATVKGAVFLSYLYDQQMDQVDKRYPFKAAGILDLRDVSCGHYEDAPKLWPEQGNILLDGLTYQTTSGRGWDVDTRLRWLALDTTRATQPYRQLAKYYRESGDTHSAKIVLEQLESIISNRNDSRIQKLLSASIGYGYRPENAIWGLFVLTSLGALVLWRSHRMGKMVPTDKDAYAHLQATGTIPANYPKFHPLMYSLENTFPLVRLGQGDKWQPGSTAAPAGTTGRRRFLGRIGAGGSIQWLVWIQILLGWVFATLFVAAVSGIMKHEHD